MVSISNKKNISNDEIHTNKESPILIGGTGGSGTRAFCQILINMGIFMGNEFNYAYDALVFDPVYQKWIRPFLEKKLKESSKINMKNEFLECVTKHLNSNPNNRTWGFKRPRNILLLEFLHEIFPKMKFIHVIRDGRDMAFSSNQKQAELFGDLFCKNSIPNTPSYSLEFWSRVNLSALSYGNEELKENYIILKYEELVSKPSLMIRKISEFTEINVKNSEDLSDLVKKPQTIGRWKEKEKELGEFSDIVKRALKEFDYL